MLLVMYIYIKPMYSTTINWKNKPETMNLRYTWEGLEKKRERANVVTIF